MSPFPLSNVADEEKGDIATTAATGGGPFPITLPRDMLPLSEETPVL